MVGAADGPPGSPVRYGPACGKPLAGVPSLKQRLDDCSLCRTVHERLLETAAGRAQKSRTDFVPEIEECFPMPSLRMTEGDSPGKEFALDRQVTVIGKGPSCDIILADKHVSKTHARIKHTPSGLYIEDLNSTNETKVGGRTIKRRRLKDGDVIKICGYKFLYVGGGEPPKGTSTFLSEIDTTTTAHRMASGVRPEEKLVAIMEVVTERTGVLAYDRVLEKVLGALFRIFPQAERGFVLFKDADGMGIRTGAMKVRHSESSHSTVSRTIYDYVTVEGRAILCEDVAADGRFRASRSVRESHARTVMCVPLWDHERRAVGVLQIDTRSGESRFGRDDLAFLVAVAGAVGMAVENARLHEVAVRHEQSQQEGRDARAVQRALLPDRTPDVPGYEFWHDYEPARSVGGDYFDYRPLPGPERPSATSRSGRWAITLGDVAGKGMPAALLMARLSSEVRLLLQAEPDPARVVERLNTNFCDGGTADRFVTFLLLVLDSDRHELTVVNAGHMGPVIRRSDGRMEVVGEEGSGPVLGIIPGQAYRAEATTLGTGDVVVVYTDGVTDATSAAGVQFGVEQLRRTLSVAPGGAGPVGETIWEAVRRHAAGHAQFDEITLMCVGRP
jgi:serine phosphatase RsbU (regulator of sigma subunit)